MLLAQLEATGDKDMPETPAGFGVSKDLKYKQQYASAEQPYGGAQRSTVMPEKKLSQVPSFLMESMFSGSVEEPVGRIIFVCRTRVRSWNSPFQIWSFASWN